MFSPGDSMVDTTRTIDSNAAASAPLVEAGAPELTEVEVTPAMVTAGVTTLYESDAIEHPRETADRLVVERVFREMQGALLRN
jgi:hypothetical protein